jgi:wobble nucleotide-excising tRNase
MASTTTNIVTETINNNVTIPSVEDWEAEGGIVLNNGESVFVKGRETYKVSRARQGEAIFCSCSAWKFQKKSPLARTCKHTEAVCGKNAEALRVALATIALLTAPKKEASPQAPAVPSPSNTRRPTKMTTQQVIAA